MEESTYCEIRLSFRWRIQEKMVKKLPIRPLKGKRYSLDGGEIESGHKDLGVSRALLEYLGSE